MSRYYFTWGFWDELIINSDFGWFVTSNRVQHDRRKNSDIIVNFALLSMHYGIKHALSIMCSTLLLVKGNPLKVLFFQEIAFSSGMHKLSNFIWYQTLKYSADYYYYYFLCLCLAFVLHSIKNKICSWSTISVQNLNIFRLFWAVYLEQCDLRYQYWKKKNHSGWSRF